MKTEEGKEAREWVRKSISQKAVQGEQGREQRHHGGGGGRKKGEAGWQSWVCSEETCSGTDFRPVEDWGLQMFMTSTLNQNRTAGCGNMTHAEGRWDHSCPSGIGRNPSFAFFCRTSQAGIIHTFSGSFYTAPNQMPNLGRKRRNNLVDKPTKLLDESFQFPLTSQDLFLCLYAHCQRMAEK